MKHFSLVAFSAERRMAAVALFGDTYLGETKTRYLPSDRSKAIGTVRELAIRSLEDYSPEFVAISGLAAKAGGRTRAFCETVKEVAKEFGIPSVEVDDATLMSAYSSYPPLTRKEHVRRIGRTIWPHLNDARAKQAAVDAATTGLYVQTQRLFSLHEVTA